jgi:diguanylate cyclase (GGDEF)-like protein
MDSLGIVLYRKETDELDYRYFLNHGVEENGPVLKADPATSFAAWCIHHGKELVIGDAMTEYREYLPGLDEKWVVHGGDIRSIIYYPITVRDETIAAFTVQSRGFRQYEPYQVETLKTLAAYVGIALENARLFEELRTLATTDSLTQCMNRRHFMEVLTAEMARSRRYGTKLSVIMFDLDHFKSVNDTYGHLAGDAVLKDTVGTCSGLLRTTDTIGRYGGEEFVFCLPGTDLEGAAALAERLRADIERNAVPAGDGRKIRITATFGVAEMLGEATPEALVGRADIALYRAKDEGRNRVGVSRSAAL